MYEAFYGLDTSPFELTTSPRSLFFSRGHREALSNLEYGLSTSKAITLLTGEAGTGKTTLVKAAMVSERCQHVSCVFLHSPALTGANFLEAIARQFGMEPHPSQSKTALLDALETSLVNRLASGETVALVVDEVQNLSYELLEEIRLLANIEADAKKLIPLVLTGQPEFIARLNESGLRQLKQRVALRCHLEPFALAETCAYIASRIRSAGGDATRMFSREAIVLIHQRSHGIPRTINVICDNVLLSGMAQDRQRIGQDLVLEVCDDFDLKSSSRQTIGDPHLDTDGEPDALPEATPTTAPEDGEPSPASAFDLLSRVLRA